jgi:hypothetical protein
LDGATVRDHRFGILAALKIPIRLVHEFLLFDARIGCAATSDEAAKEYRKSRRNMLGSHQHDPFDVKWRLSA